MSKLPVGSYRWVRAEMSTVVDEAKAKFDDAIYRMKTGSKQTASDLWAELKEAQEEKGDGLVSGLKCMGIINELTRRGQITPPPYRRENVTFLRKDASSMRVIR